MQVSQVNLFELDPTKPRQVEPAYIECENSAAAMLVSQVNLYLN